MRCWLLREAFGNGGMQVAAMAENNATRRGALIALIFQVISIGLLIGGLAGSSSN